MQQARAPLRSTRKRASRRMGCPPATSAARTWSRVWPKRGVQKIALVQSTETELERLRAADMDRDLQVVTHTGPDGQAGLQATDREAGSMSQAALYWRTVDDDLAALLPDAAAIPM
jgi:hypothetical protein